MLLPSRFRVLLASLFLIGTGVNAGTPPTAKPWDHHTEQALYLAVTLNGVEKAQLAEVVKRENTLLIGQKTLIELGVKVPDWLPDPVALDALPDTTVNYDAATQSLSLFVPLSLLNTSVSSLNRKPVISPQTSVSPGVLLNYDIFAADNDGLQSLNIGGEVRGFGNFGVFSSGFISRLSDSRDTYYPDQETVVRLNTTLRRSWPERLLTLTLGDTYSQTPGWGRPLRIAGVQIGSDFSLRPQEVFSPVPVFPGSVTTPSQVELYVDGVRRYRGEIPPGPFELFGPPSNSGGGSARIVLTDMFGREQAQTVPFYSSDHLLKAGAADWAMSAGFVRQNFGLVSADYAEVPVFTGSLRYGLNDVITVSTHAETTEELLLGGAGATAKLWRRGGVIQAATAFSNSIEGQGSLMNFGYSWRNNLLNIGLASTRRYDEWRDGASRYGGKLLRVNEQASIGISLPKIGGINTSYFVLRYDDEPASRFVNLSWSNNLGTLSLNLNWSQDLDDPASSSVFFGVAMNLGDSKQASVSTQTNKTNATYSVSTSRPTPLDGGFGWRLQAQQAQFDQRDTQDSQLAEGSYAGRYGKIAIGARTSNQSDRAYINTSGSVGLIEGQLLASQRAPDAFALVSTNGISDVPVTLSNRMVGRTNKKGYLLVPRLNAWQENHLGVIALDLPPNIAIGETEKSAIPRFGSGTLVEFVIKPTRAAVVQLVDAGGEHLTVGSTAYLLTAKGAKTVVGYDGLVYLEGLQDYNVLDVDTENGRCTVTFGFEHKDADIPQLGPFTCLTRDTLQ